MAWRKLVGSSTKGVLLVGGGWEEGGDGYQMKRIEERVLWRRNGDICLVNREDNSSNFFVFGGADIRTKACSNDRGYTVLLNARIVHACAISTFS